MVVLNDDGRFSTGTVVIDDDNALNNELKVHEHEYKYNNLTVTYYSRLIFFIICFKSLVTFISSTFASLNKEVQNVSCKTKSRLHSSR